MGAASDRAYTRKMRAPRSKKALTVQRKANPSCKIWFVCKGNLICTREAGEGPHRAAESSTTSTSPRSSTSDYSRSKSSPRLHSETFSTLGSNDPATSSVDESLTRWDDAMHHSMEDLNHHTAASTASVSEILESGEEPGAEQVLQEVEEDPGGAPSPDGSDGAGEMDDALYEKLKDALVEAENLRHEAYEETRRRQMAERELAEASKMADEAESSYRREAKQRKEMEEMVGRERAAMEQDRRELDDILDKIRKVDDRSAELELQIASSEHMMSDLEVRLSESYSLLDALRRGQQGATARDEETEGDQQQGVSSLLRLGPSELAEATGHFDESARVDGGGDGGRGKVYRGELRGVAVAVKVFGRDVAVDEGRFSREAERMSRVRRHPNLVALVGACPEARAAAYELVPGGRSLEDHLAAGDLPWRARCGVAHGLCSALAFLHSTSTGAHGDVRPANILVVGSSCRLAGLGTHRLVVVEQQQQHKAYQRATGEEERDVYALGVVLLRLATGMPPFLARKAARESAGGGRPWRDVLDACWPTERGRAVALLGLKCCGGGGVLEEACGVLEAAMGAADEGAAPPYLVCPILREVMRDPQIAGDGFTYEAEAIREWLGSGHDTSPMTNLKLPTRNLIPNHALRAAIDQWQTTITDHCIIHNSTLQP